MVLAATREALAERIAEATTAWPQVAIDAGVFAVHVERHVPPASDERAIRAWHVPDLYLACACGHGDPPALRAFDTTYMTRVAGYLRRVSGADAHAEEVTQIVNEKLLVGEAVADRKIMGYSGQAPLGAWLKIVVVNTALSFLRKKEPTNGDDIAELAHGSDLELDYMKRRYRAEFEQAFRDALATLAVRDRNVLRLHFMDGLNIDGIGTIYRVHRATVARWIAAAREQLFEGTRRRLHERLRLSPTEFDGVVGLLRSQMNVSMRSLMQ